MHKRMHHEHLRSAQHLQPLMAVINAAAGCLPDPDMVDHDAVIPKQPGVLQNQNFRTLYSVARLMLTPVELDTLLQSQDYVTCSILTVLPDSLAAVRALP